MEVRGVVGAKKVLSCDDKTHDLWLSQTQQRWPR